MNILSFPLGPIQTNAYLAYEGSRALLIDVPEGSEVLLAELDRLGLTLEAIWLTHAHYDHILGLVHFPKVPTYAHADGRILLEHPELMGRYAIPPKNWSTHNVRYSFQHGQQLQALGRTFEVRSVPGHCPGSVLFYDALGGCAFVGDAIFKNSVGRTDLPMGDFDTLEASIRSQIYTLPDACRLLPGHGPETSVFWEKAHNPYVRPA